MYKVVTYRMIWFTGSMQVALRIAELGGYRTIADDCFAPETSRAQFSSNPSVAAASRVLKPTVNARDVGSFHVPRISDILADKLRTLSSTSQCQCKIMQSVFYQTVQHQYKIAKMFGDAMD